MKRIYAYFLTFAAIAVAGYAATNLNAQAPAGGAAAPAAAPATPSNRGNVAVFNVAAVMKDFKRWQYYAAKMNEERVGQGSQLAQLRASILDLQQKASTEVTPTKKAEYEQQMVALQRQFEDKERVARKDIDDKSAVHLRELFSQIRAVVDKVAEVNGFQLVMSFPDALSEEEMKTPMYYDLKLRPPAAMPFYVSPSIDITKVVVATLNQHFQAPGPIPAEVKPTAGTAPAAAPAAAPMK